MARMRNTEAADGCYKVSLGLGLVSITAQDVAVKLALCRGGLCRGGRSFGSLRCAEGFS